MDRRKKMKKNQYVEFHTHSIVSDGKLTRKELVELAIEQNPEAMMTLAITDHNFVFDDIHELQKMYQGKIRLVSGCEVSTTYEFEKGKKKEIHIIALNYDVNNKKMLEMLNLNRSDKREYVSKILKLLEKEGIHLFDSYEEVVEYAKPSSHIGRMVIARKMVELGYVKDIDEAFDLYIGNYGERKCYVPNEFEYMSIPEAVDMVTQAGGVAVLAHPFYYQFSEEQLEKLIREFKAAGGIGMETQYSAYNQEQREYLKKLADKYDLKENAASDFHGNPGEHLHHKFTTDIFFDIKEGTN